jgi:regulator of replication initiation timing
MEATSDATAEPTWVSEIERLAGLVDELVSENERLRAETMELRRELATRPEAGTDASERVDTLLAERRAWQRQRQALADRVEVILGKFQWLEQQNTAAGAADV